MELERFWRDFQVFQDNSWYFKQFLGFSRDSTRRYTPVQVYQVYWGFPRNLIDFEEFKGIFKYFRVIHGISSNFLGFQGIPLAGTLQYKYIRLLGISQEYDGFPRISRDLRNFKEISRYWRISSNFNVFQEFSSKVNVFLGNSISF